MHAINFKVLAQDSVLEKGGGGGGGGGGGDRLEATFLSKEMRMFCALVFHPSVVPMLFFTLVNTTPTKAYTPIMVMCAVWWC